MTLCLDNDRNKRMNPIAQQDTDSEMPECIPQIKQHFNIIRKVGEGTFSNVFLAKAKNKPSSEQIALKYIVPTCHPSRTANEFKCLKNFGGTKNVIGLLFAVRHGDFIALAMPYFHHDKFQDYFDNLTADEIMNYMKNLLIALAHVHSQNIIHRDIKPSNFLYNRQLQRYSLVDFGLCQKVNLHLNEQKPMIHSQVKTNNNENMIRSIDAKVKRRLEMSPEKSNMNLMTKRIALSPITLNNRPINLANRHSENRPSYCKPLFNTKKEIQAMKPPSTIGFTRLDLNHNSADNLKISSLDRNAQVKTDNKELFIKSKVKSLKLFSRNICYCYGKNQVCPICLSRKSSVAPRAGTPGFRAPEVLLRCLNQTTALDMWSAGVIFLSLLSGCYPFFAAKDDMASLAEIITLFGSNAMKEAAIRMNLQLTTSPFKPALDMRKICKRFKCAKSDNLNTPKCNDCGYYVIDDDCVCLKGDQKQPVTETIPESAYNLLHQLLSLDPNCRISAATGLQHPFLDPERYEEKLKMDCN
uniref:non-specific serine/threonine protein kinase n=1 Tax=Strigamia maritima TaxID=126957 RepID=T1IR16_STRMM